MSVDGRMGEWAPAPPRAVVAITDAITRRSVDAAVQDAVRRALRQRLDTLAAKAVDDALDADQLANAAAAAARSALLKPEPAPAPQDAPPALYYPTVAHFVAEFLLPIYRRPVTGQATTWCPQWWRHGEANARLTALWLAWEHLRQDPGTGPSVWWRDHADHHMAVLLSADGPFKGCKPDAHAERLAALPSIAPPKPGSTAW